MSKQEFVIDLVSKMIANRIIFLPVNYYRALLEEMVDRGQLYSSNNPLGYEGIMCLGHHVCLIKDLEAANNE
jgi:hypothetical protein